MIKCSLLFPLYGLLGLSVAGWIYAFDKKEPAGDENVIGLGVASLGLLGCGILFFFYGNKEEAYLMNRFAMGAMAIPFFIPPKNSSYSVEADIFGSYIGSVVATISIGATLQKEALLLPMLLIAIGLLASLTATIFINFLKQISQYTFSRYLPIVSILLLFGGFYIVVQKLWNFKLLISSLPYEIGILAVGIVSMVGIARMSQRFSMGVGALTALALLGATLNAVGFKVMDMIHPTVILGTAIGVALPILITALKIKKRMVLGLLAMLMPVAIGFGLGTQPLGGFLGGATLSGILLILLWANGRDNSITIFTKLMAIISLVMVPLLKS